jgi:hypothetical protein
VKHFPYLLEKKLGGPEIRFGQYKESMLMTGIELRFSGLPVYGSVTMQRRTTEEDIIVFAGP